MLKRNSHATPALAGLASACLAGVPAYAATERPVFVCRSTHPVTFSDRPCGPATETRVLRVHDPGPGLAASIEAAPARESARPASGQRTVAITATARPVAADDRCRRLREERERLDDRMRAGYSAREAAQLWNRWREADAKIYAARC